MDVYFSLAYVYLDPSVVLNIQYDLEYMDVHSSSLSNTPVLRTFECKP